MLELGLNDKGANYEVALEKIGQRKQPFVQALHDERNKDQPSTPLIEYLQANITALGRLQSDLSPADTNAVMQILDGGLLRL